MRANGTLILMIILMVACVDHDNSLELKGTYQGEFYRTRDNVKTHRADVTITFDKNTFSGQSSNAQAPAICNGIFSIVDKEIEFVNQCYFTANFDWTLILNGKFIVSENSKEIIFSKEIDAMNGDYYVLKKDVASQ